jgi:hypothetical protein
MKIEIITNADNNPVAEFFSSSNTPETNEAQHEGLLRGNPMPTQVVHVNFAQKLERERDEAREAIRALAEHGESEIQRITKERDEWAAMGGRYKQERDEVLARVEIEQNINANRLLTFFAANGYSRSKTLWGVGFALGHPMTAGHSMREVAHYLGCTKQAISKIACFYAGFERESNGIVTEETK